MEKEKENICEERSNGDEASSTRVARLKWWERGQGARYPLLASLGCMRGVEEGEGEGERIAVGVRFTLCTRKHHYRRNF